MELDDDPAAGSEPPSDAAMKEPSRNGGDSWEGGGGRCSLGANVECDTSVNSSIGLATVLFATCWNSAKFEVSVVGCVQAAPFICFGTGASATTGGWQRAEWRWWKSMQTQTSEALWVYTARRSFSRVSRGSNSY